MCTTRLVTKLDGENGHDQVCANQDVVGMLLLIHGICCEYNIECQDTYAMMKAKTFVTLLWQPKDQSNNEYKKVFEALIDVVETYGGILDYPGLVLCQLVTNGVVVGADVDVLGAANTAHIETDKATIEEIMKAAIFLDGENEQTYKHIKDDLENDFSKGTDNYPTTVDTYKK